MDSLNRIFQSIVYTILEKNTIDTIIIVQLKDKNIRSQQWIFHLTGVVPDEKAIKSFVYSDFELKLLGKGNRVKRRFFLRMIK